ncbi:hypothetical protein [uncultured Coprobacter sp.]|uniref:hypothetical protein n=1 Tax=uncultured Coprobacter sp. TaxID=1720550 RepID=UPI0025F6EC34|nr:hypothetical protein [uncultured Coprobacter sp.]
MEDKYLIIGLLAILIGHVVIIAILIILMPYFNYKTFRWLGRHFSYFFIPSAIFSTIFYKGYELCRILEYGKKCMDEEEKRYKDEEKRKKAERDDSMFGPY